MKLFFSLLIVILSNVSLLAQEVSFKKRYVNHTEFGGLFGRVKYSDGYANDKVDKKSSVTIQTFNGVQLNQRLHVGVTAGIDWYKMVLISPVAAGVRYDLSKRENARFFAIADVGYGFTWLHEDSDGYKSKGGLMINPGLGLRIGKINTSTFTLSLTYKRQVSSAVEPARYDQIERHEERVYNRVAARFGISF